MKCLVLGGGGFLGSHLSKALLEQGHMVRIFERPNLSKVSKFFNDDMINWVEGDFVNKNDIDVALEGCEIVFHLISTTLPKSSNDNPIYDVETNLLGTLQLLELSKHHQVRKIVFISSGGTVYGMPKESPIKEIHPTDPFCSYGITKLTIEKYLQVYRRLHGIDYCVLRLSNPFGEWQRGTSGQGVIAAILNKAIRKESIEIWGDGNVIRDYIYVGDVIDAMLKAMSSKSKCRIFNIGSGKGRSLIEILYEIESLLGHKVKRTFTEPRFFDVPSNILDISLSEKYLHWEPRISFSDGLKRTLNWMKSYYQ